MHPEFDPTTMLFPTFAFVVFFVVAASVYWSLPDQRLRLVWLLVASAFFYMSWNPWLICLILFSASIDFASALAMERLQSPWKRRTLLVVSIGLNLGLLGYFKYVNFFLDSAYVVQSWLGIESHRRVLQVVLPLGISFYTFETISYIADVYLGRIRASRNPIEYAVFILFFPHLVSGPIVRPKDFLPQTRRFRRFNWDRMQIGIQFFLLGIFKKCALADQLALVIDPVFAQPGTYGTGAIWLAVLGYAAQIYLDFSGYSDMAIGLAHMLGYHLPANFNLPYLAVNIAEFWRRWHISLSSWLRDYLFIPLGGSRGSNAKTCQNLMIVMFLGGLWHGPRWGYVFWGLYHGMLLVAHRLIKPYLPHHIAWRPVYIFTTFLSCCVGWIFVRALTFGDAWLIAARMFTPIEGAALRPADFRAVLGILLVVAIGFLAASTTDWQRWERRLPAPVLGSALAAILLLAILLVPEDGKTFLYFQF